MTALPPPPPPPPPSAARRWPRLRRSSSWPRLLAALLAVAAAAGGGVLIGAQIVDDDESNVFEVRAPNRSRWLHHGGRSRGVPMWHGIAAAVGPSVVTISADMTRASPGVAVGTGVVVTTDGEIITNAHVVAGATKIRVRLAGETEPRTRRCSPPTRATTSPCCASRRRSLPGRRSPIRQRAPRRRGRGDRVRPRPRRRAVGDVRHRLGNGPHDHHTGWKRPRRTDPNRRGDLLRKLRGTAGQCRRRGDRHQHGRLPQRRHHGGDQHRACHLG